MNAEIERAARSLVGARFRLHGRDPATGLDCVGVAAHAFAAAGWAGRVPLGYALRGGDREAVALLLDRMLARVTEEQAGDLLLAVTGPGQLHLMVRTDAGFVHADAQLRRIVERPGDPPWPIIGAWRKRED